MWRKKDDVCNNQKQKSISDLKNLLEPNLKKVTKDMHKWSKKLVRAKSEERNKRYAFNTKVLPKITLHAFIKTIKI